MKRYDPFINNFQRVDGDDHTADYADMEEHKDGAFVKHSDVLPLLEACEVAEKEMQEKGYCDMTKIFQALRKVSDEN